MSPPQCQSPPCNISQQKDHRMRLVLDEFTNTEIGFEDSTKPGIVLVHGAWAGPEVFAYIMPGLRRAGYSILAPKLPSSGTLDSFESDVEVVMKAVRSFVEVGKDVVVVMHSYGGMVGCEALKFFEDGNEAGLIGKNCSSKKVYGNVLKLVFLSAMVVPVGTRLLPDEGDRKDRPGFSSENNILKITDGPLRCFNDLCPDEAQYWNSKLKSQSRLSFTYRLTYAAYQHYPCSYLITDADNAIPRKSQQRMVATAGIKEVKYINSGHFSQLSQPEVVKRFIRESAGESFLVL